MVQAEKAEDIHARKLADQEFEQKDENGNEILPATGTKLVIKEDEEVSKKHQSVVQNKIGKIPQIEFDHS